MTAKNDQQRSLVPIGTPLPVTTPDHNQTSILQRMTRGALDLSRQQSRALATKRYQLGEYELCEPDYLQMRLWARRLGMTPEEVLSQLSTLLIGDETRDYAELEIADGRIKTLVWDGEQMALDDFEWLPDLAIESLVIEKRMPAWNQEQRLPSLRRLILNDCKLTELNLSTVPRLKILSCEVNQLTELDLSHVPELTELDCQSNLIQTLDLTPVPRLVKLNCGSNKITKLNLTSTPELTTLGIYNNLLARIDLNAASQLSTLYCNLRHLLLLDSLSIQNLTTLYCYPRMAKFRPILDQGITDLDLSLTPRLKELYCNHNGLSKLDLSPVPELTVLYCSNNQLTQIDLSPVPKLMGLYCYSNQLTELNLTPASSLEALSCKSNKLTKIDIRKMRSLRTLSVDENVTLIR